MTRYSRLSKFSSAVALLALLGSPLVAQDEEVAGTEQVEPVFDFTSDEDRTAEADEIIQGDFEMMAGEGYFYDPGNRRDPFKSLLAARERIAIRGPRPEGIPGLLIDEVDLTGIFLTAEGPVAQVASSDQDKSFLLRVGDQLYDGDVVSISSEEAVFKQIVDDPTALKPFREVVKKLNP